MAKSLAAPSWSLSIFLGSLDGVYFNFLSVPARDKALVVIVSTLYIKPDFAVPRAVITFSNFHECSNIHCVQDKDAQHGDISETVRESRFVKLNGPKNIYSV